MMGSSTGSTRKWQFPMRKSKILAWKSLFLRRKGKIRARQSSGSLRSEASQGSSTAQQQEQIERDTTEAYCPCDASAEQASQPGLAVEHTIIPTFDLQKEKDAQFMRAIGDLGSRAQKLFPVSPVACR